MMLALTHRARTAVLVQIGDEQADAATHHSEDPMRFAVEMKIEQVVRRTRLF